MTTLPHVDDINFRNGPIHLEQAPQDDAHWYIAEHAGRIHRFDNVADPTTLTTVLDLTSRFASIEYFQQWGINSFAIHPDFANNGELYVAYNTNEGVGTPKVNYVSRFTSIDGGLTFDESNEEILFSIIQQRPFHHIGHIRFGLDGYLYIGSGDGNTSVNSSEEPHSHLGKLLRIDVNQGSPYAIPADNPYASGGGSPEVYALGLRNPWRFSFDRVTGDLWVGDVGGAEREEINVVQNGNNMGWRIYEGNLCADPPCDPTGMTPPIVEYTHAVGNSVAGGYVYRGSDILELVGNYVFADSFGGRALWAVAYDETGTAYQQTLISGAPQVTGFTESNDGELYTYDVTTRKIYKLLPSGDPSTGSSFPTKLSQTGCFDAANPTLPAVGMIPFTVASPLWSDGAAKRRWMAIPDGTQITVDADGDFDFPIGSVLAKEFSVDDTPVETRLFVRHNDGLWAGYSYEWNASLTDADLLPVGKTKVLPVGLTWHYPSRQECGQCHTEAAGFSLGPETAQLNSLFEYPDSGVVANQLATLDHVGLFAGGLAVGVADTPALPNPGDILAALPRRARAYLHVNCAGCHRPGGLSQNNMDLRYSLSIDELNVCDVVPTQGDLGVPGARRVLPGDPSQSVVALRMHALDGFRMPPLATGVVDGAGAALIDFWIAQSDVCVTYPDTDGDDTTDNTDNCTLIANIDQRDTDGDGFGNACDADLNNDGIVNPLDVFLFRLAYLSSGVLDADFNGDSMVNPADLGLLRRMFLSPPGPSALNP